MYLSIHSNWTWVNRQKHLAYIYVSRFAKQETSFKRHAEKAGATK